MQKHRDHDRDRRGLRFQDDYDLDRSHRPAGEERQREWGPGGVRQEQPSYPQERYQPSWSWEAADREDPRSEHERSYDPAQFRQERSEPFYGGQYEFRTPLPYEGYEPHLPRQAHEHHRGMFQRFKELVGKGPKGYTRSDERIREDIHERLSHGYLDASDIEVTVQDGQVTLAGLVRSKHDRRLAEDLVEDTLGVRELDNRLKIRPVGATPPRL